MILALLRTGVLCDDLALVVLVDFGVEACCCFVTLAVEFLLGLVTAIDEEASCAVDDVRGRFKVGAEGSSGDGERAMARDEAA